LQVAQAEKKSPAAVRLKFTAKPVGSIICGSWWRAVSRASTLNHRTDTPYNPKCWANLRANATESLETVRVLFTPDTSTAPPLEPAEEPPLYSLSSLYEHASASVSSLPTFWPKESAWYAGNRARHPLLHCHRLPHSPFVSLPSGLLCLHCPLQELQGDCMV
jgi:hypothetical protein